MTRIAITCGDPCGIGPEVILKSLVEPVDAEVVIYGRRDVFERHAAHMGLRLPDATWRDVCTDMDLDDLGFANHDDRAARIQLAAFETALDDAASGEVAAVVTAPWTKGLFATIDHPCVGHTEILAERFEAPDHVMMLAGDRLRVALVTTHLPLRDVADAITRDRLANVIRTTVTDLERLFGIAKPRIAVTGLNPHAGEGGVMGFEEIECIAPVIESLRSDMNIDGPFPADTLFARFDHAGSQPYDAVIAMYHDQGLIPLKTLHFGNSANITLGLPIIRTSADHGSAYDIAGRGIARCGSMRYAIERAVEFSRRIATSVSELG